MFAVIAALLIMANILPAKTAKEQTPARLAAMVYIKGGKYTPFWRNEKLQKPVKVNPFFMDAVPVTNGEFLKFVKANPEWQRSKVKRIFAGISYLRHWKSDLEPGPDVNPNSPVTNVSWFAAKAYAEWKGKRLPSISEWEYVAAAGLKSSDGLKNKKLNQKILEWYLLPKPERPAVVASGKPDNWGVYDMHGLVFEWVDDFNSIIASGISGDDAQSDFFCGSGVVNSSDPANYAAFLRFAFRNGLKASYTVHDLGFRCAKDVK